MFVSRAEHARARAAHEDCIRDFLTMEYGQVDENTLQGFMDTFDRLHAVEEPTDRDKYPVRMTPAARDAFWRGFDQGAGTPVIVSKPEPEMVVVVPDPVSDLEESAWGIIATAGNGNWSFEMIDWQDAAARWRDQYFAKLATMEHDDSDLRNE